MQPSMLQRLSKPARAPHSIDSALLDVLGEQVALLDEWANIETTNSSWRSFAAGAGASWPAGAIGENYLGHWRHAEMLALPGADMARAALESVLAGSAPQAELELARQIGPERHYMHLRLHALGDGSGKLVVAQTDVSALRRAEIDLRIAATAFESNEGKMVTDARCKIVQVNQAFCRITGYAREEVLGKSPNMLSSGRHDAAFYQLMWAALATHGWWEGEIWNRRKNGEVYPERLNISAVLDANGAVTHYVASITDITLSKAASDEIRTLAFYDPLTGLPNRRLLEDRLTQALTSCAQRGRSGALMFIDMDNFKTLNDTLGHRTGDLLLQQVAGRLQDCLRHSDMVARLGGDEFVVLVEGLSAAPMEGAAEAGSLAALILSSLNAPYQLGAHDCRSTPSIGIALFSSASMPRPDELLQQADIAMYQAKEAGRNGFRFFDTGMQDAINEDAKLEQALRHAVELEQFELHYQVQVDQYGRASGAEALIRWRVEEGAYMPPACFIPLAEENGLILPIGKWVIEQACARLRAWQDIGWMRHLELAVNVSARQFHQAGFCEQVQEAIARHGIDPALLKLELTEGMLLANLDETIASLRTLRLLGVRFSLDDFGTGYSSLQYLKRLPLDQLKIDQSFVRELATDSSDQAIVRTIIVMADSLGLEVIAEGVETEAQRRLLKQLGCHHYQGYLYSRALDAAAFEQLLGPVAPTWTTLPHLAEEPQHA
ncbi:MAG: EAL domain-containing protein [Pseudomonadota bacterium]